ncbi:MAG: DUF1934 domain-containing protein [Oscillospiraceae bacterium]|nr:DUF1934 domain-containing protein [Oscillospiraceae bacterium]
MKIPVVLSICGRQSYDEQQDPDVIELVTDGTMEFCNGGWDISYDETELTGLLGVTTTFRVEPGKITLTRTGKLYSQMIFQEGVYHESLYQMDFGALMITVCAQRVFFDIMPEGGMIDLIYSIDIENSAAGVVDYHLDIRAK